MPRAAVALGSNVGDRLGYLRSGLAGLGRIATVVSLSALYETEPVGGPKQGAYLNAVALIETDFEAGALLERLQEIENRAGRIRGERWGPRTLDLDLIVYDQVTSDLPELSVPHPRADERRFVLEPLHDVWPDASLRRGTVAEVRARVEDQAVRRVATEWRDGVPRFVDRGGGWLVAQTAVEVGWLSAAVTTARLPPRGWGWIGLIPIVAGAWMALAGVSRLGPALTPFPAPSPRGRLAVTGPYGLVRHPVYGGVVLVTVGVSMLAGSWVAASAAILSAVFYLAKSEHEERLLRLVYPEYADYAAAVPKRLLPWII